jgi:hypothetical protein
VSRAEFYERVVSTAPALAERIVIMTGGAYTPRATVFLVSHPTVRVIEKPFDVDALRAIVGELVVRAQTTRPPAVG